MKKKKLTQCKREPLKNYILIISGVVNILLFSLNAAYGQDIVRSNFERNYNLLSDITLNDGNVIKARLIESSDDKYIRCESRDGIMLIYPIDEIKEIKPIKGKRTTLNDLYFWSGLYHWNEYDDNNIRMITDNGPIWGGGYVYDRSIKDRFRMDFKFEMGGSSSVDYDGHLMNGTPITSANMFVFAKLELNFGARLYFTNNFIEPYFGYGVSDKLKSINSIYNKATDKIIAYGYDESWMNGFIKIGAKGATRLSDEVNFFYNAALKVPLSNKEYCSGVYTGLEDQTFIDFYLYPQEKPTINVESGIKYNHFRCSLFYENYSYSKSDNFTLEIININSTQYIYYFQPESVGHMVGIKVGFTF